MKGYFEKKENFHLLKEGMEKGGGVNIATADGKYFYAGIDTGMWDDGPIIATLDIENDRRGFVEAFSIWEEKEPLDSIRETLNKEYDIKEAWLVY